MAGSHSCGREDLGNPRHSIQTRTALPRLQQAGPCSGAAGQSCSDRFCGALGFSTLSAPCRDGDPPLQAYVWAADSVRARSEACPVSPSARTDNDREASYFKVCASVTPLLQTSLRRESEEPCRVSTDRPGQPRLCIWPATRCTLCDGSSLPIRRVIQSFTHLYIKDAHVYDATLSTLPVERRPRARLLARAPLEVMMPVGYLLAVRCERTLFAISALAWST